MHLKENLPRSFIAENKNNYLKMNKFKIIHSKMAFTGLRDTDLIILSKLNDEDLLNVCSEKNSYLNRICKDENYWRNRFIKHYGEHAGEYKPETRTWRRHYLKVLVDLERFKNDPVKFLDLILWNDKGIERSFYIDEQGEPILLSSAPEWVITNFWLLDLGVIRVADLTSTAILLDSNVYSHLKPFELLKKQHTKQFYLNGFTRDDTFQLYVPNFILL